MKQLSENGFSLTRDNFAAVMVGGENRKLVSRAFKSVGWCEFRIDEFLRKFPEEQIAGWISDNRMSINIIGTVRSDKERQEGGSHIPERKRFDLYKRIITLVDYVDVEMKSRIAEEVSNMARKRRKKVILSYHDFSRTPSCETLDGIYRAGMKLQPDIIKVATCVRSKTDLFTLISFTLRRAEKFPLVVIPMGVSPLERLIPLYLGSMFTYVSLTRKTAPGQISYEQLRFMKGL